nr:hypothetical protein BaRGS_018090 [Batillaria attramentaria]
MLHVQIERTVSPDDLEICEYDTVHHYDDDNHHHHDCHHNNHHHATADNHFNNRGDNDGDFYNDYPLNNNCDHHHYYNPYDDQRPAGATENHPGRVSSGQPADTAKRHTVDRQHNSHGRKSFKFQRSAQILQKLLTFTQCLVDLPACDGESNLDLCQRSLPSALRFLLNKSEWKRCLSTVRKAAEDMGILQDGKADENDVGATGGKLFGASNFTCSSGGGGVMLQPGVQMTAFLMVFISAFV